MEVKTNENMSQYIIQVADGWQQIVTAGDTVAIQSSAISDVIIQVVDNKPTDEIDWGYQIRGNTQQAFVSTHNVFARTLKARATITVQKD